MVKKIITQLLKNNGYEIRKTKQGENPDFDSSFLPLYNVCKSATMTSAERMYSLYQAVGTDALLNSANELNLQTLKITMQANRDL